MKLGLFIILLTLGFEARASHQAVCSYFAAKKIVPIAEKHSKNDKNRHCTVSCMLTLKCPADDVLLAGLLKEIKDLLGPGNAEVADLKADALGIDLALKGVARTNQECLNSCDLYYSR